MTTERYDHEAIETRWQAVWAAERTWEAPNPASPTRRRRTSYVLEMLPYPSGEPHIGHLKCYAVGDAIAHFHRRIGRARAAPDGLRRVRPAGREPRDQDRRAPARRRPPRRSPRSSASSAHGASRSTGRASSPPHDPSYYRWTQWIFLQLFEPAWPTARRPPVNWCPNDQTVLANEQVDADGHCERCGDLGRGAPARAVVLPHHRLRRAAARRPRRRSTGPSASRRCSATGSAAREGAEVDASAARSSGIDYPGLHDPARHAVRRDLLRDGARAPRRGAPRRRHRARARGARVRQRARSTETQRGARRRRARPRPASRSGAP